MPRRKPRNKGGRPSKWTPEVIIPLTISLRNGGPMADAARRAGVGKSTLYRWIEQARSGDPRFAALADHAKLLNLAETARTPGRVS